MEQSCNWVFTLNNPSIDMRDDDPHNWDNIRYCVYQVERGESGTLHLQGYCIVKKKRTLNGMKKLNQRAHWAIRRGSHDEARAYCLKEPRERVGDEWGEPPRRGARTDVASYADALKQTTMSEREIFEQFPDDYLRFGRMFDRVRSLYAEPRNYPPKLIVFWGPTRTGKSRRAYEENPGAYFKMKNSTADWWDGYSGQETVIINDFYGWIQHCELLRLCDRYPHQVKIHGGFVNFSAKKIVFTSNKHPKDWYNPALFPWEGGALKARFDEFGEIIYMGPTIVEPAPTAEVTLQDLAEFAARQVQHPPHDLRRYLTESPELQ